LRSSSHRSNDPVIDMTFQSSFMVVAPLDAKRKDELRSLLATMNRAPGTANPNNEIIPFGRLPDLHFARIVILEDQTLDDITTAYDIPRRDYPLCLAFLADFDGDVDRFINQMVSLASKGLEQIFSYCTDFKPGTNIVGWMKQHEHRPSTMYVNWVGRTMQQIREENALRQAVQTLVFNSGTQFQNSSAEEIRRAVKGFVQQEVSGQRLKLTPVGKMPLTWRIKNFAHLIFVPLLLLFITPLILLYLPIFAFQLRRREKSDMEIAPRPAAEYVNRLATIEDYDVTNQFTAMGSLKPGLFRRWLLVYLLWIIQYTTRHIYTRGHLARVPSIHFARWVFIDNKKRLVFCSNYDSSLETYMDDFINKVAFGLNVVFSNGIGYPTTNWLVFNGAKDEQRFKYFIRRHELPTEVWYDGHSGLTNFDQFRNSLIRNGLEKPSMTNTEAVQWLQLL
jgi:hypothetical protein